MSSSIAESADSRLRRLIDRSLVERPGRGLDELLYETVEAGGAIVGCRYAAISVLGLGGRTEHFVHFGVDGGTPERIGRAGPPSGHPSVRSLLEVPIVLRGRPAGQLYLSRPARRPGFDETDERTANAIASAAANIIERARTAAENARRDRWLTGAAELVRDLATARHEAPLALIAQRLVEIADADLVAVVQAGPSDDTVVVTAAAGVNADTWDGYILPAVTSMAAKVMRTGKPRIVAHLQDAPLPEDIRASMGIDAALLVPLGAAGRIAGVITISRRTGRAPFSSGEMGMATMFAGQAALALELADTQARRNQMALVEERDRIARDLHDHVIQRLFAIGLSMQSAGMHVSGRPADQLRSSIDDIDETIKQIRSTIYRLSLPIVSPHGSIRAQATRVLDDLELALGFRPTITVEGPVEFGIDEGLIDDCIAVLREALTNVARHAEATRVEVGIRVTSQVMTLDVQDNGRGIGARTRRSGLSNLRTRAERRDGSLTMQSGDAHGTRLVWSIPVEGADAATCRAE